MSIKLFLLKLAAKKGRRQAVRRVQSLGHVKGQEFMVPRENAKPVMTYLYRPTGGGENLPVVFNVHGGAWVGGDALLLDTQSQEMADRLGAMVVNINYVKADVKPFPYAQYEIRDTVRYFAAHAKEYDIDAQRFAVMGYSAGGHLSACAAQLLQQDGIRLSCQVLCYPFLDFTFQGETNNEMKDTLAGLEGLNKVFFPKLEATDPLVSPGLIPEQRLKELPPAILVTCGQDALKSHADRYAARLEAAGVHVQMLDYPDSIHGFLECNFPETEDNNDAKSPAQKALCDQCERDIAKILCQIWDV